jgi:hypothetical protein
MQKNKIKDIFILSCYPNVYEKERLLNETVDKLKQLNKTVLIASHFPVPQYIVKKCDYYIYDAYNMLDIYNHTLDKHGQDYWIKSDCFLAETIIVNHTSALSRIFGIAMQFIKSLNYDYFIILETDSEFDINDLKKFDLYKDRMVNENKDFLFFKPKFTEYAYQGERIYESYCFGGFLKKFLEKFEFPITLDEWNSLLTENKFFWLTEYVLMKKFISFEDKSLILGSIRSQFINSKIDLFTVSESTGIFYNSNDKNRPILFLHNQDYQGRVSKYDIKINMHTRMSIDLDPGGWYYKDLDLNKENTLSVSIKSYRDNKLYSEYKDFITKENLDQKVLFKKFTFLK